MLSAQAQDLPAAGQWGPQGLGGVTELRREGNHNPESVPNPSQSRAMEPTVGNSRFKGIRLLGLPRCLGRRLRVRQTRLRNTSRLAALVTHAHWGALGAPASAPRRFQRGVGFPP